MTASLTNSLGCIWNDPICNQRRAPSTFFPANATLPRRARAATYPGQAMVWSQR